MHRIPVTLLHLQMEYLTVSIIDHYAFYREPLHLFEILCNEGGSGKVFPPKLIQTKTGYIGSAHRKVAYHVDKLVELSSGRVVISSTGVPKNYLAEHSRLSKEVFPWKWCRQANVPRPNLQAYFTVTIRH